MMQSIVDGSAGGLRQGPWNPNLSVPRGWFSPDGLGRANARHRPTRGAVLS